MTGKYPAKVENLRSKHSQSMAAWMHVFVCVSACAHVCGDQAARPLSLMAMLARIVPGILSEQIPTIVLVEAMFCFD